MHLWRIARQAFDALDGEGARRVGGRWNSPGRAAVYAAGTQSLAILETLIHLDPDVLPNDYVLYRLTVPDTIDIATIATDVLPPDWREPGHAACRTLGDAWLSAGETALLRVPPAPLHESDEYGYVINPQHPDAARLTIVSAEPFAFDLRLI
jgi:RES domain-containing protein